MIVSPTWAVTLLWCRSLCVSEISRAMPAGAQAPGRSNHAGQVLRERPDKTQSLNPVLGFSNNTILKTAFVTKVRSTMFIEKSPWSCALIRGDEVNSVLLL